MENLIQSILILAAVLKSTAGAVEVVYAQVGDTVTLRPPRVTDLNRYYMYWYFGKNKDLQLAWRNNFGNAGFAEKAEQWKTKLSLSDDSLIIKGIQQENFGTIVCELTLAGKPTETKSYQLLKVNATTVPAAPLVPGESLTLICSVETPQGQRTPQIRWLNPQGEKMTNQRRHTVSVTGKDNGQWTCVVTHDNKESQAKISVTVVDLSPAPLRPQYTSKSTPLTVPCSIPAHISWDHLKAAGLQEVNWHFYPKPGSNLISNDPQRLFFLSLEDPPTWKKDQDRQLTPVPDVKKGRLSLTRKQGREEDGGDYNCSMKLRRGLTVSRMVHVKVLQITSSPGIDLISGQQVDLTCSVGEPLPSDLRVKWVPPKQSSLLSLTPDHHPAHLTIPEVGTEDGGTWKCELWQNNTLLTSAVIKLEIEFKLSVWMLVLICSVAVIIVLLLILVFIVHRRRQRKTRHIRHRLCKCKNPKPKGFYRT
uniref:CD4-1 molecule n=1 Tax=Semicossyphus pulcher TaxID=241346 RepID=UPI0037E805B9